MATIRDTAERLRLAISKVLVTTPATSGAVVTIDNLTASIGAAVYPTTATELDELLLAVDTALYQAKNEGRDQVCLAATNGLR
jgi:diguanylate cyclase (GGDEF)-like protein